MPLLLVLYVFFMYFIPTFVGRGISTSRSFMVDQQFLSILIASLLVVCYQQHQDRTRTSAMSNIHGVEISFVHYIYVSCRLRVIFMQFSAYRGEIRVCGTMEKQTPTIQLGLRTSMTGS
jgi:uncharacterized membrane protein